LCQPMAPALPIIESGDFGRSPFFGQLSGKHLPASNYVSMIPRSKHNRDREIRVQHLSAVRLCGNKVGSVH
jgi:hypothetical protein